MTCFLDASALAKLYLREANSDALMARLSGATVAISRLSEIEVASAAERRYRLGELHPAELTAILAALDRDLRRLRVVELQPPIVAEARLALHHHGLCAADAVQLASALVLRREAAARLTFLCFDARLASAAQEEGLDVIATLQP